MSYLTGLETNVSLSMYKITSTLASIEAERNGGFGTIRLFHTRLLRGSQLSGEVNACVAESAGESKIGEIRLSAMFFGNNVVDLVRKETEFFRHPAVFTTTVGSLVNQAAQGDRDASPAQGRLSCRTARF